MSTQPLELSQSDVDSLEANTFVSRIEFYQTIGSTSDLALQLAGTIDTPELPLLVVANEQTAGRGRGANRWIAAPGALTFSLIVDPTQFTKNNGNLPQLSLVVGLALRDALASRCPSADFLLKWPNDVYAVDHRGDRRKIAGILLECPPNANACVVIGIGVNVNNSLADAPEEIRNRAISLVELAESEHALCDVLSEILHELRALFEQVKAGPLPLPELWQHHCMLSGHRLTAQTGNRLVTGICHGIDVDGALLLQTDSGMKRIVSGTIQRIGG